jgi:hypothetical protein
MLVRVWAPVAEVVGRAGVLGAGDGACAERVNVVPSIDTAAPMVVLLFMATLQLPGSGS